MAALAGLLFTFAHPLAVAGQQPVSAGAGLAPLALAEASEIALPLPEDRGTAALEQALRRLGTTASVMMIVAHPDDEDGTLLTYLSRGLGARVTLLTLTRGEGGQNAMCADSYDELGLIRTNELLKAGEYYGVKQLWGTEVDFGFSKTQEEAFSQWGHERVLYDAVLAVRRERPQIIVSTFVGGITDGHGHHQVSGEIAQEVIKAAADPKVFPEQLKDGLAALAAAGGLFNGPFRPDQRRPDARLRHRQVGLGALQELRHRRMEQRATFDRRDHPGGHAGPGAGAQLFADCPRGLGPAEVAVRRGESGAERPGGDEVSPLGRGSRCQVSLQPVIPNPMDSSLTPRSGSAPELRAFPN